MQTQKKASNNVITFIVINFNKFIVSNFIEVLQIKIDKITKRRRIAFLLKTLQKTKIDDKINFRVFVIFDKIFILSMRSKNNAKFNRQKLYRMINSKKYSSENLQNFKKFLCECVIAF